MSQDSGGEPRQRTVAELLAQYGESGSGGGNAAPRRRRRRAENDAEETAPQAIIDRVLSDSGRMRPVQENAEPPQGRTQRRAARSTQSTQPAQQPVPPPAPPATPPPAQPAARQPTGQHPPVAPQDEQPTAMQQPVSQSAAERARRARRMTSRFSPAVPQGDAAETRQQPPVPPAQPGTGSFPPARPPQATQRHAPVADPGEPLTEQLSPVVDDAQAPRLGEAPAGLGGPPTMRSAPVAPDSTGEQTQYGMPALDDDDDYAEQGYAGGYQDAGYQDSAFQDQGYQDQAYQDQGYQDPDYQQDESYAGASRLDGTDDAEGYADPDYADEDYDDETGYDDEYDEDTGDAPAGSGPSSSREWLVLAGLIAAGVLGGALVWLGFNWLWGTLPQVALIPALIVIGGMVWIVRRVRNDDDLQTTVLSVLVGLVVTVSPAAFLLLDR